MDEIEIELENIRLRHQRRLIFFQGYIGIALGIFALNLSPIPFVLPLGISPTFIGIVLIITALTTYEYFLGGDEDKVLQLKSKLKKKK
jgi:hypothetical protein